MSDEDATTYEAFLESDQAAGIEIETMEFKSDLTYTVSDGTTSQNGVWEISSDEKTLTVDKGTDHEDHVPVKTLTDTAFAFEVDLTDDVDMPGLTYKLLVSLERI